MSATGQPREIVITGGVETYAGTVRRARTTAAPIAIPLTTAERLFMLCQIANITAAADAILHNLRVDQLVTPWQRENVTARLTEIRNIMRDAKPLFVFKPLDYEILANAIERNPYFACMRKDDPRLTAASIRQAEHLRSKLALLLNRPIGRVPLPRRTMPP